MLAEAAEFEADDPRYHALKAEATHLVDDYCKAWTPASSRGRRSVKARDVLVIQIAAAFHEGSGWAVRYKPDDDTAIDYKRRYRGALLGFVALVLAHYDSIPISFVSLVKKLPRKLRDPRP
jgi:hypothetical protein